ncbi:hypothetical protein C8R42DRAFT_656376 [Lentinula raphanica]|nr:hypothetical protein C8R42DRAFT_656376 [Lentinula raphanica]
MHLSTMFVVSVVAASAVCALPVQNNHPSTSPNVQIEHPDSNGALTTGNSLHPRGQLCTSCFKSDTSGTHSSHPDQNARDSPTPSNQPLSGLTSQAVQIPSTSSAQLPPDSFTQPESFTLPPRYVTKFVSDATEVEYSFCDEKEKEKCRSPQAMENVKANELAQLLVQTWMENVYTSAPQVAKKKIKVRMVAMDYYPVPVGTLLAAPFRSVELIAHILDAPLLGECAAPIQRPDEQDYFFSGWVYRVRPVEGVQGDDRKEVLLYHAEFSSAPVREMIILYYKLSRDAQIPTQLIT